MLNSCLNLLARRAKKQTWLHLRCHSKTPSKNQNKCKYPLQPFDDSLDLYSHGINAVDPCRPELELEQPRVVIIGAGMAGLAAAHRLCHYGIHNFVILEANERPGGRIYSRLLGDMPVELGAGYRSQTFGENPVFKMCTWPYDEPPPDLRLPATPHTFGIFDRVTYGQVSRPTVISAYYKFRQIEKEANSLFCHGGSKTHGSLVDFMGTRIQQDLHTYPEETQHDAARIMFGLAHLLNSRCSTDYGWITEDDAGVFLHMPGSHARVPLGLSGILAPLMQKIPGGNIRYCKPVNCVNWGSVPNSDCRALVSCCDGDTFKADYVIVTVSIGVLDQCRNMFCPHLPYSKLNAVNNLQMDLCNKIYLDFCEPFPMWLNTSCTKLKFSKRDRCCRCDWTRGIVAIETVPHSKHLLCAWVTGEEALEMEMLCDIDIVDGISRVLCTYMNSQMPCPVAVLRSHWSADPYFRGAGTHVCTGMEACQQVLAAPVPGPSESVPPILLFAGEATSPGLANTVAGAKISGIREAERIMQLTYGFKGRPGSSIGETPKRSTALTCT